MALSYQRPDTQLTLAEGLREYYASRDGLVGGRGISSEAREFFRCHDAAHVVFGCTTTLLDEAIVKLWSFFGTTAGLPLLRAYRLPESQEIYQRLEWSDIVPTAMRSIVVVPLVFWRCLRMRKRWPWPDFDRYLDVPLREIRSEYGIQLVFRPQQEWERRGSGRIARVGIQTPHRRQEDPMVVEMQRSIVFAKDVPKMTAFYRDLLGLTPAPSEHPPDEWMALDAGPVQLALHRIPSPWRDDIEIADPPVARQGARTKLVFRVDDLRAACDELVSKGVRQLDSEVMNRPGEFVRCDFLDPEGNVFQLSLE